jgi:protein gp37
MTKTGIEWTDEVWNPVTGCSKVSAGCKNCYAEAVAGRYWAKQYGGDRKFTDVRCHPERLDAPLHWRKPRRVFVNSMSDLFHDEVSNKFIAAIFGVMAATPQHTFQVLTKRPGRMREFFAWMANEHVGGALTAQRKMVLAVHETIGGRAPGAVSVENNDWPLPNVWLGVSCEDQRAADERVPLLLETLAAVRFLSCEPLLGPIDLSQWLWGRASPCAECPLDADCQCGFEPRSEVDWHSSLGWVIVGGESGPGYRLMRIEWAQSLREQCRAAGVPFFFKQGNGPRPGMNVELLGQLLQEFPEGVH